MRKFSTLIHLKDEAQPIADALESLNISDEVLVIDHVASEKLRNLVREHGAKVVEAIEGVEDGAYVTNANNDWVLWLRPTESISEELRAALQRWREQDDKEDRVIAGYTVAVEGAKAAGKNGRGRELRFVNRTRINWTNEVPDSASNVLAMPGFLRLAV